MSLDDLPVLVVLGNKFFQQNSSLKDILTVTQETETENAPGQLNDQTDVQLDSVTPSDVTVDRRSQQAIMTCTEEDTTENRH